MPLVDTAWYCNYGNGSSTGYYAVTAWAANTAYAAGAVRRQSAAPAVGSERCFVCIVAGTSHLTTEPTWTVTRGAKTTDNTVTWQEATGQPGLCGDTTNCTVWLTVKNTAVVLGQVIYDSGTASLQICSTAGTAGNGATPGFSATAGTTTADNTVTWTSLGLASGFAAWANPHARKQAVSASTWMAAGNTCYISNNHAETQSAALTMQHGAGTGALPLIFYCVSDAAAPPTATATTATISTTGNIAMTLQGFFFDYGITYSCGTGATQPNFVIGAAGGGVNMGYYSESCVYKLGGTGANNITFGPGGANNMKFSSASWVFGNTGCQFTGGASEVLMVNNTFAGSGTVPSVLFKFAGNGAANAPNITIMDSDLSAVTGTLASFNGGGGGSSTGNLTIENSKLGAAVAMTTSSVVPATVLCGFLKLHNCDSANTNYRYFYGNYGGTVQHETTVVRTGSLATNGTTPISWNIITTAVTTFTTPFVTEDISIWNDSTSSVTVTLYLISNTTLNNNDFWAEAEYLGTASFPQGVVTSNRMALLGTAAALTSDSSTWGGSTNKYKIVFTFTPASKGPIKVRFYAAKASATTYVDPYIYLS